ncbi:MAG TPA: anti-sigma regulatory factor [Candidatus Krumholzibacteria bacterium]|nr:anti-sigma regulatory factor [Candidatus Krumholzibacteria bacterium]
MKSPRRAFAEVAGSIEHRSPAASKEEPTVPIQSDLDILVARQNGRALAQQLGLSTGDQTVIATVISELARNILLYARPGWMILEVLETDGRKGLRVVARDDGPGIADIERAMQVGYSTSGSLGLGLPGVRRLVDDFEIFSRVGEGTTVTITKWKP